MSESPVPRGIGTLRSIVLECSDPAPLAEFWSHLLGREITQRDDDWWSLAASSDGARLSFQVSPGHRPPPWPGTTGEQQIHLDVLVDDLTAATAAVTELGASILSDVVDADEGAWRVFADPAGHPFCLVT